LSYIVIKQELNFGITSTGEQCIWWLFKYWFQCL